MAIDVSGVPQHDPYEETVGWISGERVEDAVIGLLDELAYTRDKLDRRYDDLDSERVQPIEGEEAFQRLMGKTKAHRRHRSA